MNRLLSSALIVLATMLLAPSASAYTYVVTTSADSGPGSLRAVIEYANTAIPSPSEPYHRIVFHQDVNGVTLLSALPPIHQPMHINPDSDRRILISSSTRLPHALTFLRQPWPSNLVGRDSIVDQIDILCFQPEPCFTNGIVIGMDADNVLIDRTRVDRTGGSGIEVLSRGVVIDRSTITRAGSDTNLGASTNGAGVYCSYASGSNSQSRCSELTVTRSYIGVTPSGAPAGNRYAGLQLGGFEHQIGGLRSEHGNVIGDNGWYGISGAGHRSKIQGNYIGIGPDGTLHPNGHSHPNESSGAGIQVSQPRSVLIGGDVDELGNVITGNTGVNIAMIHSVAPMAGDPPTRLRRNRIGTRLDGTAPGLVSTRVGIRLEGLQDGAEIGAPGHGNRVAHHLFAGLAVVHNISGGNTTTARAFRGNFIHDNGADSTGAGIRISGNTSHYVQPAPAITSVTGGGFAGTVQRPSSGDFHVDIHVDDGDQGQVYWTTVLPDMAGNFSATVSTAAHNGRQLTAIATWIDPATGLGTSSAFSAPHPIGQMTLFAATPGSGAGNISSDPVGIDCGAGGSDCEVVFPFQTVVELTATPASGSYFAGWEGGGCTGSGSQPTCTVTMNLSRLVHAVFEPIPPVMRTVNISFVSVNGSGGRVISDPVGIDCTGGPCSGSFPQDTELTLHAVPNPDSFLDYWHGGRCHGTTTTVCTFTVTGNSIEAPQLRLLRFSMTADVEGQGRIQSSPFGINCGLPAQDNCHYEYFEIGSTVTLTPHPLPGEAFLGWQDPHCAVFGTAPCVIEMQTNEEVHAVFSDNDRIFGSGFEFDSP